MSLWHVIREILIHEWAPLESAREDEYIACCGGITRFLVDKVAPVYIAEFLYDAETKKLGLDGDWDRCAQVADKLIAAYVPEVPASEIVRQARRVRGDQQGYFDLMLSAVEAAKDQADSFTLATALTDCAFWLWGKGRVKEALNYLEQRLDPSVWQDDKLEIRCVRNWIKELERQIASEDNQMESK